MQKGLKRRFSFVLKRLPGHACSGYCCWKYSVIKGKWWCIWCKMLWRDHKKCILEPSVNIVHTAGKIHHKKHLMVGKSKELSQDLRNLIVAKHIDDTGYIISKLLNVSVKWKEHDFNINWPQSGAPCRSSDRKVKRIIRRAF